MTHNALARLSVIVAIRLDYLHRDIAGGGSFDGSDKHTGSVAGRNAKVKKTNELNTTKAIHYTTRINSAFQALSANMTVEVRIKTLLLTTMQQVIGGIQVQPDFLRRLIKGFDEHVHEQTIQRL